MINSLVSSEGMSKELKQALNRAVRTAAHQRIADDLSDRSPLSALWGVIRLGWCWVAPLSLRGDGGSLDRLWVENVERLRLPRHLEIELLEEWHLTLYGVPLEGVAAMLEEVERQHIEANRPYYDGETTMHAHFMDPMIVVVRELSGSVRL